MSPCAAMLVGDGGKIADQLQVFRQIFGGKARVAQALVVLGELSGHGARQQPAPQRRIGHEADGELAHGREDLLGLFPVEDRIFALDGVDGMHRVGPAQGGGIDLAQAQRPDLALLLQPRHGAHGVLDGHERVDAVLVIEVDHIGLQPLQAGFAGGHDMLGPPIGHARTAPVGVAEFGGDHDAVATALQRAGQQALVMAPAIFVGGVEKGDADVERPVDEAHALLIVRRTIGAGGGGAAQPQRKDADAAAADGAIGDGGLGHGWRSKGDAGCVSNRRLGSVGALTSRARASPPASRFRNAS